MKKFCMSYFFTITAVFSLLIAPLPLSAIAQEITEHISIIEKDIIAQNPDVSYVDLSKDHSNIAEIISQLSNLDEQPDSPVHQLNAYIKNGFSFAEYNEVLEVLEYA